MWTDPIVEEVRRERDAYAAQFDYDLHAMCVDLRQQEQESVQEVVTLPPRRPLAGVADEQAVGQGR